MNTQTQKKIFPFGTFVDVTEYAKKNHAYAEYEKVFVCVDTWDFWIARILKDVRNDDLNGYEECKGSYILERNKIAKESKADGIGSYAKLYKVLEKDDLSSWDCHNTKSLKECIELLDDGFGIEQIPF